MFDARIFVGGLTNPLIGAPQLAKFLLSLGVFRLRGVDMVAEPQTRKPRGFAFVDVTCASEEQLRRALRKYHGTKWQSCRLKFGRARTRYMAVSYTHLTLPTIYSV